MEIATIVLFVFLTAVVVMAISIPLLVISRLSRMIKKSYAKLFHRTIKA